MIINNKIHKNEFILISHFGCYQNDNTEKEIKLQHIIEAMYRTNVLTKKEYSDLFNFFCPNGWFINKEVLDFMISFKGTNKYIFVFEPLLFNYDYVSSKPINKLFFKKLDEFLKG